MATLSIVLMALLVVSALLINFSGIELDAEATKELVNNLTRPILWVCLAIVALAIWQSDGGRELITHIIDLMKALKV